MIKSVVVAVVIGHTYLSAHFQQPIARTYLSAHFQQPIASQPLFHSFTTFTVRGKTGEDGVEA